jgi:hypothetical protein
LIDIGRYRYPLSGEEAREFAEVSAYLPKQEAPGDALAGAVALEHALANVVRDPLVEPVAFEALAMLCVLEHRSPSGLSTGARDLRRGLRDYFDHTVVGGRDDCDGGGDNGERQTRRQLFC